MRRTTIAVAAGAAVTLSAAVAAVVGFGGHGGGTPTARPSRVTAKVQRTDLVDTRTVNGQLDYGPTTPVTSHATGTLTWLPAVGATIVRGGKLLRADDQPVVLLYGPMPAYRPLTVGVDGPDVKQFEQNLKALGYTGFTVDDEFSAATATAVERWQADAGWKTPTGVVDPAGIVYQAGPVRVQALTVRLGAPADGDVLAVTGTRRMVTVAADAGDHAWAAPGATVTVTLPAGARTSGTVTAVADTATADSSDAPGGAGGNATVDVTVDLPDQAALGDLAATPVQVSYVLARHTGVLAVPVTALLALAEGGYGLEVLDGSSPRIVAVTVGLFAGGLVEVSGADVSEGLTVGLPS